jgi:hypothetical protein
LRSPNKVAFSSATDAALLQSEYIALVAEPNLAGVEGDRVLFSCSSSSVTCAGGQVLDATNQETGIQPLSGNADTVFMMSVATWFAIGAVTLIVLSAVVGLLIAAVLGSVSRNISELLEAESSALMPLTRARLPRDKSESLGDMRQALS